MRFLLTGVLLVLAWAPATATAAVAPASVPALPDEVPYALGSAGTPRSVLVTSRLGPNRPGHAVIALPSGRRSSYPNGLVLDSVAREDGGIDLLVRRGSDLSRRGDLILRRVTPSGRVYDLWSVSSAATDGAIARARGRTVVAWPAGSTLRLVTRPDGGLPTRPRSARLGLRGYNDLDLAIDARGRAVAAVTGFRAGLVLASLTTRGRVVRRQVARGVDGLVEIAVTAGGRVGVLTEDTGIEGEGGECVGDNQGRHIRVVVRAARNPRFGAVQTLESPRFGCGSTGALLRALPGDGLAAVYQGGSYDHPPLLVRAAFARAGRRFEAPTTLATDARADSATVARSGALIMALLRRTDRPEVFSGRLSLLRSDGAEDPIAPTGASAPLLATDATGSPLLAWRAADALHVAPAAG